MNQKQRKPISKKKVITSIVALSAIAGTGYEANRLAADPLGEKDCPPVFAGPVFAEYAATDSQINVEIAPLSLGEMLKWEQKGGMINDVSCLD